MSQCHVYYCVLPKLKLFLPTTRTSHYRYQTEQILHVNKSVLCCGWHKIQSSLPTRQFHVQEQPNLRESEKVTDCDASPKTRRRKPRSIYMRSEVKIQTENIWVMITCSLVGGYKCFRGTCLLHLQSRCKKILQNDVNLVPDYTMSKPST
jgi:hypothetical protein